VRISLGVRFFSLGVRFLRRFLHHFLASHLLGFFAMILRILFGTGLIPWREKHHSIFSAAFQTSGASWAESRTPDIESTRRVQFYLDIPGSFLSFIASLGAHPNLSAFLNPGGCSSPCAASSTIRFVGAKAVRLLDFCVSKAVLFYMEDSGCLLSFEARLGAHPNLSAFLSDGVYGLCVESNRIMCF